MSALPDFEIPWAVRPREVPADAGPGDPSLFLNSELSWIDFNWRVLHQALDTRHPLQERVRFLAITATNLDEFFMKRVGGLMRQREAGVVQPSPDGRTPAEQLELVQEAAHIVYSRISETWERDLRGRLAEEVGLVVRDYDSLGEDEKRRLHDRFRSTIYPVLTPLAVDPGHPFPFISNMSLSLAVVLRHPQRDTVHFARLKIPRNQARWIELDEPGHVLPIEQLVRTHVDELFRGMEVESAHLFRVTRNADMRRDEEEAEDLLRMISEELRERRFAQVVRLEIERSMPDTVLELLLRELDLTKRDVYRVDGQLDFSDLHALADANGAAHRFEPWEPVIPARVLREGESEDVPDIFAVIRSGDLMVHHPYDSFAATVLRFVEEAAVDPRVLAIKQTIYRTSQHSPIVDALIRAAENGKQVAVLVEVTARFDEEENIEWGQMLEHAGVHVTYGLVGLKTHAKVTLVVRADPDGIRAYTHIGTGNYHSGTARQYTDIGILTSRPEIAFDVVNLFHYLTGYAPEQEYRRLIVAPRDMRRQWEELIDAEIEHQRERGTGCIIAKMNGLDDVGMIEHLYRASDAGVPVDLVVRGICRIRPGLSRWSENIRVVSIVGRFLEHDRIFYFHNDGAPRLFIGSADWRRRNLEGRVEAALEVDDPAIKERLRHILDLALVDDRLAWDLAADGSWTQRRPTPGEDAHNFHEILMKEARERRLEEDRPWEIEPGTPVVRRHPREGSARGRR